MPKESSLELKVGLFVLIGLAALTIFIFSIADSSVFERGKTVKVVFGFANGLKKNAPVRIAGVDQGMVADINLFFDRQDNRTKAQVVLKIKKEAQVPQDSRFIINQLGLLGEKYVEITPGVDTKQFIQDGTEVIGKDPIAQEILSERVMEVANKLDQTIAGVNTIIRDEKNVASIRLSLENIGLMTGSMKDILADVKSGKGTVGRLLYDESLYDDFQAFSADLKANPWKLLYRPKGK